MPYPKGDTRKPAALTPDVRDAIVAALEAGSYLAPACRLAGAGVGTFNHWRRRVEAGDPSADHLIEFFDDVNRASAVAEHNALDRLQDGPDNWRASAWFLERRFPRRWGGRRPLAPKVDPTRLHELSDAELDALAARL